MAAVWTIKTLLVDNDMFINDVVWNVTDEEGEYVGVEAGVFSPEDDHPLRSKTYDNFNDQQIIAHVKASIGGQAVSSAEREAAISRSRQRKPIDNYVRPNRREVV